MWWLALGLAVQAQTAPLPSGPRPPDAFPTGPATTLGQRIAAIAAEPGVVRAHWGIAVTDLDGTPVYGLNEGEYFRPASNAKLFTTAAAMHLLGPMTKVTTAVTVTEPIAKDGTVKGNITLFGSGAANLSGIDLPYVAPAERKRRAAQAGGAVVPSSPLRYLDEMAAAVAAKGITHITGDVIGDDTVWPWEPYPSDWTIDDAVWGYGAPVSALTVTDNELVLTVEPGVTAGKPAKAKLTPETGYYTLEVSVQTVAAKQPASIRIDRAMGSHDVRVSGTVAAGEPYSTELAVEDPAEFAAGAFLAALRANGVRVDGEAVAAHRESDDTRGFSDESHEPLAKISALPADVTTNIQWPGTLLAEHPSPSLAEDVALTLKVSQNLHAELLLRRLGRAWGENGSSAQGARVVRQFLLNAGLHPDDFAFYDGSGLSGHDLVTPRATARLLAYATHQTWFPLWRAGLPVGGEDGSLAHRFPNPPLKGHLFAKTGTLSETRALSGYVDCASGKTMIFSIMVDNHAPNTQADRDAMDRIVAAIAAAN